MYNDVGESKDSPIYFDNENGQLKHALKMTQHHDNLRY